MSGPTTAGNVAHQNKEEIATRGTEFGEEEEEKKINRSTFPQVCFNFLDLYTERTIHTLIFWEKLKTVEWTCDTQSSNLTQVSCSLTSWKIPLLKKQHVKKKKNPCFFSRSSNWAARWKDCHSSCKLCHLPRVNYVKNMSNITHCAVSFHIDCNNLSLQFLNHIFLGARSCWPILLKLDNLN